MPTVIISTIFAFMILFKIVFFSFVKPTTYLKYVKKILLKRELLRFGIAFIALIIGFFLAKEISPVHILAGMVFGVCVYALAFVQNSHFNEKFIEEMLKNKTDIVSSLIIWGSVSLLVLYSVLL